MVHVVDLLCSLVTPPLPERGLPGAAALEGKRKNLLARIFLTSRYI